MSLQGPACRPGAHRRFRGSCPQSPNYHLRFRLWETSHRFPFTDDLEFHLLELPKFTKSALELSSGLDSWLYFLRHMEQMDTGALPAALQQQPLVLRAVEELKMFAQNDVERERYEARRKPGSISTRQ